MNCLLREDIQSVSAQKEVNAIKEIEEGRVKGEEE